MTTYCDAAPGHEWHGPYHDLEYGFPLEDDAALFERLGFDPAVVAAYGARDRKRLLADAGIIRNRLKVDAAIANAQRILELRKTHGSFAGWLSAHHPRSKEEWVKLFKKTFRFTGGEIVGEFLRGLPCVSGLYQLRQLGLRPPRPWYPAVGTGQ
jgi:DNA-3-methyladenine glycosylase I